MSYIDTYHIWQSVPMEDPDLTKELKEIEGNDKEIKERFVKSLEFGTAGLRGILGAGTNRMNIYTVRLATQGMADYLNQSNEPKSVAIGYDSRIKSRLFAKETACVFAANGIKVHLFNELMPTPALSFAVRELHCGAGIVVTASHNPSQYNGYKAYGPDGCQLNPEAAAKVLDFANKTDIFTGVRHISFGEGMANGSIEYIPESLVQEFLDRVYALRVNPDLKTDLNVVYTPLNGSGNRCVRTVLNRMGVNVTVVPLQEQPDGRFPTCPYPNPEEKETLSLGINLCEKINGDLVLATDPDADRVAIAVNHHGKFILPSGNELGVLMLEYIAHCRKEQGTMPEHPVAIKSIVTTPLADEVAKFYGIDMIQVLTGFKYIGEQISILADKGETDRLIMGYEESCGYLTGDHVRDKDAVNASVIICEMASYYKAQGKTLIDVLEDIFARHGVYAAKVRSYTFPGTDGSEKMASIMSDIRENPPKELGGFAVEAVADYKTGKRTFADGTAEELGLPSSNVLEYKLEKNLKAVIRPSGTEPKIKVYLTLVSNDRSKLEELGNLLFTSIEHYLQ